MSSNSNNGSFLDLSPSEVSRLIESYNSLCGSSFLTRLRQRQSGFSEQFPKAGDTPQPEPPGSILQREPQTSFTTAWDSDQSFIKTPSDPQLMTQPSKNYQIEQIVNGSSPSLNDFATSVLSEFSSRISSMLDLELMAASAAALTSHTLRPSDGARTLMVSEKGRICKTYQKARNRKHKAVWRVLNGR